MHRLASRIKLWHLISKIFQSLRYFSTSHVTRDPVLYFRATPRMPPPSTLCRYGRATWAIKAKQHPQLLATRPGSRTNTESRPRPFRFVVGASWLGKPPGPKPRRSKYLPSVNPFDPKSPIGEWRDKTLEWPKGVLPASRDPGHDFFYIQPVRT
jgi:hypothetical protein